MLARTPERYWEIEIPMNNLEQNTYGAEQANSECIQELLGE
jgi:hypothetical protein